MKLTNETIKKLKGDFPIFKNNTKGKSLIYLDSAATTQKPKQVIDSIKNFYENENANIHRGVYTLSEEATVKYNGARKLISKFINAKPEEIIFTRSATESINLLAYTLSSLLNGDEIVVTEMEHHSNFVPWQQFAKRNNMKLKIIAMKNDFTLDYEDAKKKITENTALVAVTHVSNALGTINDINTLVKLAKEKNALTLIDAAQSAPHLKIDVKDIDCDFLVFSGHKMLAPMGIGILYGKKELLEKLPPFHFGGDMIKEVNKTDSTWNEIPMKFEAGTQNVAGVIALGTTINYLNSIGMENIEAWEKELLQYSLDNLSKIDGIEIYHPGIEHGTGIISFNLKGIHPHDLASLLNDENICIRGGHHCSMPLMDKLGIAGTARISFYLYNTFEDIDKLIESLKKSQRLFGE
ncbi:cysteine desulfurase [Candidatus Woesearchaeota archaeon]|jgi:cysteine desulfurase/selenocysteine lyase|nr:cysteine desulfurase [Candidatus Woesearchaeota archaeon]